jgi:hypothetical protein
MSLFDLGVVKVKRLQFAFTFSNRDELWLKNLKFANFIRIVRNILIAIFLHLFHVAGICICLMFLQVKMFMICCFCGWSSYMEVLQKVFAYCGEINVLFA